MLRRSEANSYSQYFSQVLEKNQKNCSIISVMKVFTVLASFLEEKAAEFVMKEWEFYAHHILHGCRNMDIRRVRDETLGKKNVTS